MGDCNKRLWFDLAQMDVSFPTSGTMNQTCIEMEFRASRLRLRHHRWNEGMNFEPARFLSFFRPKTVDILSFPAVAISV